MAFEAQRWLPPKNGMDTNVHACDEYVCCKVRLVGGPILIALQYDETSKGLAIAAIILLNIGAIPLIATNLGFVRAM